MGQSYFHRYHVYCTKDNYLEFSDNSLISCKRFAETVGYPVYIFDKQTQEIIEHYS
jgi:hypothetical protein